MAETTAAGGYEAFLAHAQTVAKRFEDRRAEFLRQLKFRCALGVVLLLLFPLWFSVLARVDAHHSDAFSSLSRFVINGIAGAVMVLAIAAWSLMPLFRYRHYTVQIGNSLPGMTGISQQVVSLKGEIFSKLFSYFGDFTFYENRSLTLKGLRNAPELPEFDECVGEDYLRGTIKGVSVEMMETELCVHKRGEKHTLFSGLMIVLDIDNMNLVLRGKFAGRTVAIVRESGQEGTPMAQNDPAFKAVALPDTHFIAYGTDEAEARKLLNPELLQALGALSEMLKRAHHQQRPVDDRLAYAISSIAHGLSDALAVLAEKVFNWFVTGRAQLHPKRRSLRQRNTRIVPGTESFNASVHCSFYEDKVLISIPSQQHIFEPDIIFRPPLHTDDIQLAYHLMTALTEVADAVLESLPREFNQS